MTGFAPIPEQKMLGINISPFPRIHSGRIPFWSVLIDHGAITQEVLDHDYDGSGTEDDPYAVAWLPKDSRDPQFFSRSRKISITLTVAFCTLIVSLASSAYSGSVDEVITEFGVSTQVATLGLSLYVLGFAIGPLFWAPIGEVFGRQISFFISLSGMAAFLAGCAGASNIWTLCILRCLAGSFGGCLFSNAGGTISDLFSARQRGLALSLYAAAPFLGPSIGPIIGGFLGMNSGWRWVEGLLSICAGLAWLLATLLIPETYAPVLLRKRAQALTTLTGHIYRSKIELEKGRIAPATLFKKSLLRPWTLLLREPIVLLSAIYVALVYGTLYMFFAAFPIVFQQTRGWNQGVTGLSFLGVMIGMILGSIATIPANIHYIRIQDKHSGRAPPETRLLQCMPGALAIPLSQFWFAWTNYPSIHWVVPIIGTAPFGFGVILIYLGCMNYLIDSYTLYAASVLAANAVLRSVFGAVFPIVSIWMYDRLGIHWAPSIPAFLSLVFMPFPFVFYKYGAVVRGKCRYAAESERYLRALRERKGGEKGVGVGGGGGVVGGKRDEETDLERSATL